MPIASPNVSARKHWMGVLARSNAAELEKYWQDCASNTDYQFLRKPEQGLVMVQGRAGGSGQRFNLGEVTVTRCSVKMANGIVGHAYIKGRDQKHAELAAAFDALLQDSEKTQILQYSVIAEIDDNHQVACKTRSQKAAATKVEFFTMVRGEDD